MSWDKVNLSRVDEILAQALAEDLGRGDLTCAAVLPPGATARAKILSKDTGVIAGLPLAERVFRRLDHSMAVSTLCCDGDRVSPGATLMRLNGQAAAILSGERTALNLLGRCSGIATLTAQFVAAVREYPVKILDTRKTAPLLRELDRYAVRLGGGENHRMGLDAMILLKENHLKQVGGIASALQRVLRWRAQAGAPAKIEIEVTDLGELEAALAFPVDRIMLDNFSFERMAQGVKLAAGRGELEASGGVTLQNVEKIAATGVQYISVGALTHSVKNFDLTLLVG